MTTCPCHVLLLDLNIPPQRLESLAGGLNHGDGLVAGFADVDVSDGAAFAFVCAGDDCALGAVVEGGGFVGWHDFFLVRRR